MRIIFNGNKPTQNLFRVGVMGNNLVDMIKMVVPKVQGKIDLGDYKCYLKISSDDRSFMDKTSNLEISVNSDDPVALLEIVYMAPVEVTSQQSVDMQLSFERITGEEYDETLVWQSSIFHVNFDTTIDFSDYLNKYYPDIVTEMLERIEKLEHITIKDAVQSYESLASFPNVGDESTIYIDESDNTQYRYDTTQNVYIVIGEPADHIKTIDCNDEE